MTHFYKIRELATIGRVNEATLRRAIADGRLKAVRIGRVLRISDEAFARFLRPVIPSEKSVEDSQGVRR